MIDLGTLGGLRSYGRAINAAGQVAGNAELSGGNYHAVVYNGGVTADLGTLGGAYSLATGINGSAQVCGWAQTPSAVQHAFLYSGGVMTDLGTLSHNPADTSYANGINDSGQVTGLGYISGFQQAYLYSGGVMTNLGTLGGRQSAGVAINALGQIAGNAELPDGPGHAFLYSQGKMLDLGLLPGSTYSEAFGLNDHGDVVGQSSTTEVQRAMIYSHGVMTDLNSLIDPSSGWFLLEGDGINDLGQITGYGRLNGQGHGFLLTRIVPEPSTLALGAAGVTLFLVEWRRRSTRKRPGVERGAL
jgi:probable HAF family extracellular repeat protein